MQFQQQLTSNLNMRFITRRLVSLLVVLMVFTMISSTSNVDNKEGAIASTLYEDEPVYHMFYWPSRGRSPQRHGILFAVWEDGVVLMPINKNKPGENLQIAKLKEGIKPFMEQLEKDGVFKIKESSWLVPDASFFTFKAKYENKSCEMGWDESISRGYGANNKPDQNYREMVKSWYMMRITLASVRLAEVRDLQENDLVEGKFRGYDVDKPYATSWR